MTISTVDLRAEAAAEARRLTIARALLRDGDERTLGLLDGSAPWIAIPRRSGLKRALGPHVCCIWRAALEDGSGRIVESRLVPLLVHVAHDAVPRAGIRALLREVDGLARARVETACEGWRSAATRVTRACASARLSRERAAESPATPDAACQPGLFDRRAERSRTAHAAAAAESEQEARARRRTLDAAGTIAPGPARLLLVLVP